MDEPVSDAPEPTFTAADVEYLNQRALTAEHTALRLTIAAKYGINAEDSAALLTAEDETGLNAQAERLAEWRASTRVTGPYVPSEGKTPERTHKSPTQQFANRLFGRDPDLTY